MDFGKLLKNVTKDLGSNLTYKIGNPPNLKTKKCFCMWSDLCVESNSKCKVSQQGQKNDSSVYQSLISHVDVG